ncbi:pentapeptide repeat-containing protein [Streptomyces sp. NPDC004629]|uniref:pentapeptide repeat-containing protein n=1 Tax=Streptomyces sp. NPDC004629 TaxID=3364705 RepID=UPI0036845789
MNLFATTLPALAAVAALIFTWISVAQVSDELTISEQGQIAERYDTAVEKLVDDSMDVRRGAIYSMQSIMTDSPRMQPAVIDMLSKYIRDRATKNLKTTEKSPDIQAALYALGNRNPSHDGNAVIDLRGARLEEAKLEGMNLTNADLRETVISGGNAEKAVLSGARLEQAVLHGTNLTGADLSHANASKADLKNAVMAGADLAHAYVEQADLRDADLTGADLSGVDMAGANLEGAYLAEVTWNDTNLAGVRRPEGDLPDDMASRTTQPPRSQATNAAG